MLIKEAIELSKNFKFTSNPSVLDLEEIKRYNFYRMERFDDFEYIPNYDNLKLFEFENKRRFFAINISEIKTPKDNIDYLAYAANIPSNKTTRVKYFHKALYYHPYYVLDDYLPSMTFFIMENNGISRYYFHNIEYNERDFFIILAQHEDFSLIRSEIAYENLSKLMLVDEIFTKSIIKI